MKTLFTVLSLVVFALTCNAQTPPCDPALVTHYNMGDFPFTSSTGVTVNMAGTNSGTLGPYGPYGCSPATCDANTIRLDPGDTLIFNFSQTVYDFSFVSGVMNTTENGKILTNGATPILTSNCPSDLQITGNAFNQVGPLGSPVITVSIPGGATSVSIVCLPASNNGVFTVDMLDCINELTPSCETTSSISDIACDSYPSPSGNYNWTTSGIYMDTIPNAAGCDSVMTFDLTINNSSSVIDQQVACDSFTWIDGNTYLSSTSIPTYTLTNVAGCDSLITLNLTINNTTSSNTMITECDSFTWNGTTYTTSGIYTWLGTNTAGCDSLDTLELIINTVDISVTNNSPTLIANAQGATYQWIDCDNANAPIPGETNASFTANANGNYAVIVTDANCSDTSICYLVDNVGVNSLDQTNVRVYPNPAKNYLKVDFDGTIKEIQMLDMSGRIASIDVDIETGIVSTDSLAPGNYLLQVTTGNEQIFVQLVIIE